MSTHLSPAALEAAIQFTRNGRTDRNIQSLQDEAAVVRAIIAGAITAYLDTLSHAGEGEPDFWALHAASGMHIGLWSDRETAERVLKKEPRGTTMTALYRATPRPDTAEGEPPPCAGEGHDHPAHDWRTACLNCGVFRGSDLYATPRPDTAEGERDLVGLSASDRACYLYPEADQQLLRAAYIAGAVDYATKPAPQEGVNEDERVGLRAWEMRKAIVYGIERSKRDWHNEVAQDAAEQMANELLQVFDFWFPNAQTLARPVDKGEGAPDKRPANCRNRRRDEGKAYPRSGCAVCRTGGMTGCPHDRLAPTQGKDEG